MQNISLSKKIQPEQENYQQAKQQLFENLIAKITEKHLQRKFKEEDFKDITQTIELGCKNKYQILYKETHLGEVTEKQTENSLTLNFRQSFNY